MAKTNTKTEVKDRLFGDKKVKQAEETKQGDKSQVNETKTKVRPDGTHEKSVSPDKGDDRK